MGSDHAPPPLWYLHSPHPGKTGCSQLGQDKRRVQRKEAMPYSHFGGHGRAGQHSGQAKQRDSVKPTWRVQLEGNFLKGQLGEIKKGSQLTMANFSGGVAGVGVGELRPPFAPTPPRNTPCTGLLPSAVEQAHTTLDIY